MNNLPTEIILEILKNTDYDTRKSMCQIDKRLFSICKKYKKYLRLNDVNQLITTGKLKLEGVNIQIKIKREKNPIRIRDYGEWAVDLYIHKPINNNWFNNHIVFFKSLDDILKNRTMIIYVWIIEGRNNKLIFSGTPIADKLLDYSNS